MVSFLELPSAVRCQIYRHVFPQLNYPIELNPYPSDIAPVNPSTDARYMLQTCRTVYNEAAPLFHSTNHLFVRYWDFGDMKVLRDLTPTSMSALRFLTVHLNVSSCEKGAPCCRGPKLLVNHNCLFYHDKSLGPWTPEYFLHSMLSEWHSTVKDISMHIPPSQLHLSLVCDVKDIGIAERVLQPLLNGKFPILASCNIRLGRDRDSALYDLARKAATQSIGQTFSPSIPEEPFRFLDLPRELQYQILEYTDLVTPWREITWNPEEGFYLHYDILFCRDAWCAETHYSCQFRNCHQRMNNGCFCNRYHAAFSTATICRCWGPPTSLFLLSKSLRQLAQSVFFSKNRFIIMPSGGQYFHKPRTVPWRLEASIFLRDVVPPDMLSRLWFLELVFPPVDPGYIPLKSPAYQDWVETISYVQEQFSAQRRLLACLRIYFYDLDAKEEDTQNTVAVHKRIISPLSRLGENGIINQCFVFTSWRRSLNDLLMIEQSLERQIMGCDDGYDSKLAGKNEQRMSQWLKHDLDIDEEASVEIRLNEALYIAQYDRTQDGL